MSKIFYEETHNKLRKLFSEVKRTEKGEMEIERPGRGFERYEEKYNFVNNPFVRKYASFGKFSNEMAKLVESEMNKIRSSTMEEENVKDPLYKSMADFWKLLSEVFDYKLR